MRGIVSAAGYVPYRRLDRADVAAFFGGTATSGQRAVASYDEDTTTMGVAAARLALGAAGSPTPTQLWFATAEPTYLDKTNATAVHAALRLDADVAALDFGGAVRSGLGALRVALESASDVLVVAAGLRTGLPTSADEAAGGDGAAAVLVADGPVVAEVLGTGAATAEFTDRWRVPGTPASRQWEERFGEVQYVPLADDAWRQSLEAAGIEAAAVDRLLVTGPNARAVGRMRRQAGVAPEAVVDDLAASVGHTGAAHPLLLIAAALEAAGPGEIVAVLHLADGADAMVLRTTDTVGDRRPASPVAAQVAAGAPLGYGRFLAWRDMVTVQPPNRPVPERVSSSAAARNRDWKFGLARPGGGPSLAGATGRITTFTVDRLAWSPSPPVVFAVVDLDTGDRLAVELTDVDADAVAIGDEVEMTFRRLGTADGLANYFWKARPVRGAS